ncbi:peptidoglycan D,D-transpeptidase FtsI family protein [Alkaliphilus crotonatoxidans]
MRRENKLDQEKIKTSRILILGVVSSLIIMALGVRLFYIQFFKHELYTTEVNKQRSLTIPLSSGRGLIYDRNLIPLTDRTEETVIIVFPQLFTESEENMSFLSEITGISIANLKLRLPQGGYPVEFTPREALDWQDQRIVNTRGLFIINKRKRYDQHHVLSHVIGYISGVDRRGISGLEKSMEEILQGQESRAVAAILDGRKRLLPGEGYRLIDASTKEQHVKLTVDYHIQKIIESALDQKHYQGAIVVSEVATGKILAMASRPNFDPNQINQHLNSQGDELYNKAVQMTFPPGSIFKIIVAAAALEDHQVTLEEEFTCTGMETVGNIEIRCNSFEKGGNGTLSFQEAFAKSCNSTFIQVGQRLGANRIMEMARAFGLGQRVDINLVEEEAGYLPQGDQLIGPAIGNISIGQGEIEVTPLQINQLTQIIANDGVKKPLTIVEGIIDGQYRTLQSFDREEEAPFLRAATIKQLQHLMGQVMEYGTGKGVGSQLGAITAGKTGTAQSSSRGKTVLHAWFSGYYPKENPQYAITIFIQDGQSGGGIAVPLFKEIVEAIGELGL